MQICNLFLLGTSLCYVPRAYLCQRLTFQTGKPSKIHYTYLHILECCH